MTKPLVVLVTGASKGIGRGVADLLAADGHQVVGFSRSSDPTFPGTLIPCDMMQPAALAAALAEVNERFAVRGLVNNFGGVERAKIADITPQHIDKVMRGNLFTAIECTQAVLPGMQERGSGRIVNLASRAMLGRPGSSIYAATKAAIVGLSRSWALELAKSGVTVNVIAPGTIDTDNFRRSNPANPPPGAPATPDWSKLVPMGRVGAAAEIAAAARYFLSEEAAYTTGQVMYVCGGLSVGAALL